DAALPAARVRRRARLRVGAVERVVLRDEDAAETAERLRLLEELAALIEDLQADVAAIGDEQPAARVEREAVRRAELPGRRSELAPARDERAVLRELRDARHGAGRRVVVLAGVPWGAEGAAVGRREDVVGLGERVGRVAGNTRLAQRQQDLSVGAELDHLVADELCRRGRRGRARRGAARGPRTVVV